jgi:hypothetical protein
MTGQPLKCLLIYFGTMIVISTFKYFIIELVIFTIIIKINSKFINLIITTIIHIISIECLTHFL